MTHELKCGLFPIIPKDASQSEWSENKKLILKTKTTDRKTDSQQKKKINPYFDSNYPNVSGKSGKERWETRLQHHKKGNISSKQIIQELFFISEIVDRCHSSFTYQMGLYYFILYISYISYERTFFLSCQIKISFISVCYFKFILLCIHYFWLKMSDILGLYGQKGFPFSIPLYNTLYFGMKTFNIPN